MRSKYWPPWDGRRDVAYSSSSASLVGDVTKLLLMSSSIAEQALVDVRTVAHGVSVPFAPLAPFIVLLKAMLLPVCKVVETGVEHGPRDI
jgi:hypothetical protein